MSSHISRDTRGFTLIELMVVMVIIGILFIGSYVPYDYYSRLSKVRISVERINQAVEGAKILSQNGQIFPGTSKNASIGLFFKKDSSDIDIFAFLPGNRSFIEGPGAKIIKTVRLEDGVLVNTLPSSKVLIEFSAPKGIMEIYTAPTATGSSFDLGVGWKTATAWTLYRTIKIEK